MKNSRDIDKGASTPSLPMALPEELWKEEILGQVEEAGQVVVHCRHMSPLGGGIRIWRSTFLDDRGSAARSRLLHVFGITVAPEWLYMEPGALLRFILVFEPLPKSCTEFDFNEDIPEPGGFFVPAIKRNKSDIYQVDIL